MCENKNKLTQLSDLGEFKLIDKLNSRNKLINSSSVMGIGDDAAVISYDDDMQTVVTNDVLVEGIHFDFSYSPLKYVGYKAVVVNLSDIYAMNAEPEQILVSFAVSNRFSFEALDQLYAGIYQACEEYGVDLVGGDTTSSKMGMFLSITALGKARKDKIVTRDTAKINNLVCVSGDIGAAFLGLQVLEREKKIVRETATKPDWGDKDYLLQRQLRPEARADIIKFFKDEQILPTAMIDVSDGVSSEILHICEKSKVGAIIYEDYLPINKQTIATAEEMNMSPTTAAMNGGEDYELLFTVDEDKYKKIDENYQITVIGKIVPKDDGVRLLTIDGQKVPIVAQGWNALKNENKK